MTDISELLPPQIMDEINQMDERASEAAERLARIPRRIAKPAQVIHDERPRSDVDALFPSLPAAITRFVEWAALFGLPINSRSTRVALIGWPVPQAKP